MARPRRIDQLDTSNTVPLCEEQIVHVEAVRSARRQLPESETIGDMAALFGALADPTRLRIVGALAAQELCVCDLAATLQMTQSAISHQLRILRDLRLVRSRRDGRRMYYRLDDQHVTNLFTQAFDHSLHAEEDLA